MASNMSKALAGLGMVAVGVAAGVAAERGLVAKKYKDDKRDQEPFGNLRGNPVSVRTTDGIDIYVEVDDPLVQPPDDLAIVFCHGYALTQDSFHFQRRDLRGQATLVFWDQRSHGRSDKSAAENISIDQLGDDLYQVIQQVVPNRPVILVGHSMGGMTVMAFADQHPDMLGPDGPVKGVALLATSSGQLNSELFGLPANFASRVHNMSPALTAQAIKYADAIDWGRSYTNDLSLMLTNRFSFGSDAPASYGQFTSDMLNQTSIQTVAEFLSALQAHDKREALKNLRPIDTLIMVGEKDVMTPIEHYTRIVSEVHPEHTQILANTGHMLILERHYDVNAQLLAQIRRVRSTPAPAGTAKAEKKSKLLRVPEDAAGAKSNEGSKP